MALPNIPGVPLYVQIRETLREEIRQGKFEPGQQIPPEEELAAQYGVSRMTLRHAITDLIEGGLIYRRHGVGTFVTQRLVDRDHTRLTDFFESASASGREAHAEVLSHEVVQANALVANALSLEKGDAVVHIRSIRSVDSIAITLHDSYVPEQFFSEIPEQEIALSSPWTLLERRGLKISNALERLEAREADEVHAGLLGISEGEPVLYKERIIFAEDGTPVEYEVCYNRGDKYSCTVILKR